MALKKSTTVSGRTGNYWRIERIDYQNLIKGSFSFVWLGLYTDKAHSNHPNKPIVMRQFAFPESALNKVMLTAATPANPYIKLYDWLKTQPEFAGAIDE